MVAVDIIARYEALRRRLAEIEKQLGTTADDEAKSIDELIELDKQLPDGYEWWE